MSKIIIDHIKSILSITSGEQHNFYRWLLENGRSYTTESLIVWSKMNETRYLIHQIKEKACFSNSLKVSERIGLDYVEGFYVIKGIGIPFEHAWNQNKGFVWDFTSRKFDLDVIERFGVVVPKEAQRTYLKGRRSNGESLLYHYYINYIKIKENDLERSKRLAKSWETNKAS